MRYLFWLLPIFCVACASSKPILASDIKVQVSREEPPPKCREIGRLTGSTPTVKGTQADAIEDLKKQAADKGGNYVLVKQFSGYGTAVTGVAYECP